MRRQVAALARDRVSGATALARHAARLLRAAARDDGKSLVRWQRDVRAAAEAVIAAQPAMGSLLTLADLAWRMAARAPTARSGARAVRRALDRFLLRQPRATARAAARLPALLPAHATCLTLSSSEVVYRGLFAARARGRLAHVVVAESRPGYEGVALARRLAAHSVGVTVIVDALAPAMLREVDAAIVGADAVTPTAVWNKCGTLSVALAARAARRPLFVVTTEDRLLGPALARRLRVPEAEPDAVLSQAPRGVRVLNRLFDRTPLGLVTRVVTEAGVTPPATIRARISGRRTRPRWLRRGPITASSPTSQKPITTSELRRDSERRRLDEATEHFRARPPSPIRTCRSCSRPLRRNSSVEVEWRLLDPRFGRGPARPVRPSRRPLHRP